MPFKTPTKTAAVQRRDALTGRIVRTTSEVTEPPEPDPAPLNTFELADAQAALAVVIRDRSSRAQRAIEREFDRFAADATAAPLKRLRLRRRGGPISQAELSVLSRVSERAIRKVEAGEPASDLVMHALAVALECRRDQVDPMWVRV